ncbi:hypothetical protein [Paenibacillus glycinis]|uniref:Yip1 domain-containing protein n=1 Tax=Paenibacillus glycinis TaxID=2697035 RepID=A0ABW9XWZ5_9BACL|nr:hypothetical protein [Paenibacillus glycinis]NBD26804.1 hypothetical protein [Paenibacillus glycinis]
MNYCMQCGQETIDGEVHACQETAAASAGFGSARNRGNPGLPGAAAFKVDVHRMLALVRNPQHAENLQPGKDWIYGAIGLVASILGFMIWVWMIGKKIDSLFGGWFGGFGGLTDVWDTSGTIGSMLTGRLFVLAVISLASLLTTLWLVGSWQGGRKLSVRELATYVGGAQYTFAAGFVVAGMLAFVNMGLSFAALSIVLLSALAMNLLAGLEIARVSRERRFSFIGSSIAVYVIIVALLSKLFM